MPGSYTWIRAGSATTIVLCSQTKQVSYGGGPYHGEWSHEFHEDELKGVMHVKFHWQADAEKMKKHELVQLHGTRSFWDRENGVVMVKHDDL